MVVDKGHRIKNTHRRLIKCVLLLSIFDRLREYVLKDV